MHHGVRAGPLAKRAFVAGAACAGSGIAVSTLRTKRARRENLLSASSCIADSLLVSTFQLLSSFLTLQLRRRLAHALECTANPEARVGSKPR